MEAFNELLKRLHGHGVICIGIASGVDQKGLFGRRLLLLLSVPGTLTWVNCKVVFELGSQLVHELVLDLFGVGHSRVTLLAVAFGAWHGYGLNYEAVLGHHADFWLLIRQLFLVLSGIRDRLL